MIDRLKYWLWRDKTRDLVESDEFPDALTDGYIADFCVKSAIDAERIFRPRKKSPALKGIMSIPDGVSVIEWGKVKQIHSSEISHAYRGVRSDEIRVSAQKQFVEYFRRSYGSCGFFQGGSGKEVIYVTHEGKLIGAMMPMWDYGWTD